MCSGDRPAGALSRLTEAWPAAPQGWRGCRGGSGRCPAGHSRATVRGQSHDAAGGKRGRWRRSQPATWRWGGVAVAAAGRAATSHMVPTSHSNLTQCSCPQMFGFREVGEARAARWRQRVRKRARDYLATLLLTCGLHHPFVTVLFCSSWRVQKGGCGSNRKHCSLPRPLGTVVRPRPSKAPPAAAPSHTGRGPSAAGGGAPGREPISSRYVAASCGSLGAGPQNPTNCIQSPVAHV